MNLRTANPALRGDLFQNAAPAAAGAPAMSVRGVVWKTALMLAVMVGAGAFGWRVEHWIRWLVGGSIATSILGVMTRRDPKLALATVPLYAAGKGIVLGLGAAQIEAMQAGFAFPALCITAGCAATMLLLYCFGWVAATQRFAAVTVTATGGAGVLYAVIPLLRHFGIAVDYPHAQGWLSMAFSVYVLLSASANLVLDFDVVRKGVEQRAPKSMEWYAAFSLVVTLVWLYVEAPRLLTKMFRK